MRVLSWIRKLLGFGADDARRQEERDFPLYLTRLEDRQVLSADFSITPANVTQAEGNTGVTTYSFTITPPETTSGTNQTSVKYTVSADGSTPAAASDFQGGVFPTDTLTFDSPNQRLIQINVQGDATVEGHEGFKVVLSDAVGGGISSAEGTATGTITNDDTATLTIGNVSIIEGDAGTQLLNFTVTLNNAVQGGFTVTAATQDGTAQDGSAAGEDSDYVSNKQTLTFAGNAGETQTFSVTINGDAKVEANETFQVLLSDVVPLGTGVSAGDITLPGPATGTINNNDTAALSISNESIAEGNSGTQTLTFTVTLSNAARGVRRHRCHRRRHGPGRLARHGRQRLCGQDSNAHVRWQRGREPDIQRHDQRRHEGRAE